MSTEVLCGMLDVLILALVGANGLQLRRSEQRTGDYRAEHNGSGEQP